MSAVLKQTPPIRKDMHNLIQSDRVEGTAVYRSSGDKIGSIERLMLEKSSGRVAYAVMSFGGFLGLGHEHYPIPWERLTYNESLGGYEVNISDAELEKAPKFSDQDKWDWSGERGREIYSYYGVAPYWGM